MEEFKTAPADRLQFQYGDLDWIWPTCESIFAVHRTSEKNRTVDYISVTKDKFLLRLDFSRIFSSNISK